MLRDIADCLERSGAKVSTDPEKLELVAYWGHDRFDRGWVGVTTSSSYGDVPLPVWAAG